MSLSGGGPILFEPSQLLTPPGSPTKAPPGSAIKRRQHLRDSDDNSGELQLEAFLYRTDPYRSSNATTPFPLPSAPPPDQPNSSRSLKSRFRIKSEYPTYLGIIWNRGDILRVLRTIKTGLSRWRCLDQHAASFGRCRGPCIYEQLVESATSAF